MLALIGVGTAIGPLDKKDKIVLNSVGSTPAWLRTGTFRRTGFGRAATCIL
jgi:hypothetical protein